MKNNEFLNTEKYLIESDEYDKKSLESLNYLNKDISILKNINNVYGLESNKGGSGYYTTNKKSIIKIVGEYISSSFEKLMKAIMNFLKTISVKISSKIMRQRCSKYATNEKEFNIKLNKFKKNIKTINNSVIYKNKKEEFKTLIPNVNLYDFIKNSYNHFSKVNKICNRLYKNAESLFQFLKDNKLKRTDNGNFSFINNFNIILRPDTYIKSLYDDIVNSLSFGQNNAKEYLKKSGNNYLNLKNPKTYSKVLLYNTDSPKLQSLNIDKYLKVVDYRILKDSFFDLLNSFLTTGKEIFNNVKKSGEGLKYATLLAQTASGGTKNVKKLKYINDISNYIFQYSRIIRLLYSFSVSLLLNIYSEMIYHQNKLLKLYKMSIE